MKKLKKAMVVLLSALFAITPLAACGGGPSAKENELTITFYEGGFGRDWLVTCLDDFVAEKKAAGVEMSYKLIADADITKQVNIYLSSGKNLSDIYMTQGNSDWPSMVGQGYLANLSDVYETEVSTSAGKVKVKDYIVDEISEYPYMQRKPNQGAFSPWIMPWSLLETCIIYNKTLLEKTPKAGGGFWTEEPKTMEDLAQFCNDINAASKSDVYGLGKDYVSPFSWAQSGINYFQSIIYVLWAQQQGVDVSNIEGEGSFYDFWNVESPDVWKQTGIQTAIDEWRKIIVDESTGNWKNSISNCTQIEFRESATTFCDQKAVMLLGGSFFENEMKNYLDEDGDGKYSFEFRMMNVPFSDGCIKNENGENAVINYCSSDDMMFIPAKATNLELAKEFLAYMCNEKYLVDFTKKTGCLRPFKYDPVKLTENDSSVVWSDFFRSCFDMKDKADYNIYTFPKVAAENENVSLYYVYYRPQLFQGIGVVTACLQMKNMSGKQIMIEGPDGDGKNSVYKRGYSDWTEWKNNLGI